MNSSRNALSTKETSYWNLGNKSKAWFKSETLSSLKSTNFKSSSSNPSNKFTTKINKYKNSSSSYLHYSSNATLTQLSQSLLSNSNFPCLPSILKSNLLKNFHLSSLESPQRIYRIKKSKLFFSSRSNSTWKMFSLDTWNHWQRTKVSLHQHY